MKNEEFWGDGRSFEAPDEAQLERWLDTGEALRVQPWLDALLQAPSIDTKLLGLRALGHLGDERGRDAGALRLGRGLPQHEAAQVALLRTVLNNRGAYAYWRCAQTRPLPQDPRWRAERLSLEAYWLSSLRDERAARRSGREALSLSPDDPWLWTEYSYALARLDRRDEAREACEEALRRVPGYRTAIQHLARLDLHDERPESARERLESVLTATGSGSVAWQLHGLAWDQGRHADALQLIDQVERGWPRATPPLRGTYAARRADSLLLLGRIEEARVQALQVPGTGFYSQLAERLAQGATPHRRLLELPRITQHWMTCAPATLAALARFWDRPAEHLEVAQAICYDGTPYTAQRSWALEQGFAVREFTADWDTTVRLIDAGLPFALGTQYVGGGHLQAVVGYDALRQTLLIRDPSQLLHAEYDAAQLFDGQQSGGPRALLLLPPEALPRLQSIDLPDRAAWDIVHDFQSALQCHDRPGALVALERLSALQPEGDPVLRLRRGLAIYDGNEPLILAATEALLARYPDDGDLHLSRVASLYEVEGQSAGDAALAARANRSQPDAAVLARWSARVAADGRRLPEALSLARRALRRDGLCGRAWNELGERLWALQGVQTALEPMRCASTLLATEEWAARDYARACRIAGCGEQGLAWLQEREQTWGDRSSAPTQTLADELDTVQRDHEADELLDRALARRPADAGLRLFLAERWLRRQRLDEAASLLEGCADAHAPGLLRLRALLFEARGDLDAALAAVREAVSLEPLHLPHHRLLLRLLRRQLGDEKALVEWRPLVAGHPAHFGLQRLLYEALPDEPGANNAQLALLQSTHPRNAWLQRERAIQASRQGRLREAIALAEAACALAPELASGHDVLAYCLIRAEGFAAALPAIHRALKCDAEYESALQRLMRNATDPVAQREAADFAAAELRRQPLMGDGLLCFQDEVLCWPPEDMLEFLQGLAAQWPTLWQGPVVVARQLCKLRRSPDALPLLREAAQRFPALPRVHLELAEALRQAGDFEAALQANARALALSPSWNKAVRLQVDLLGGLGCRWDEAIQVIQHSLMQREGFDDADLMGLQAWVLEQQGGRDSAALELVRRSLLLDPRPGWIWQIANRICTQAERLADFDALIDSILAGRPGDADAWLVEATQGRDDAKALAAAEQALRLDPRLEAAWKARFDRLQRLGRGGEIAGLLAHALPWPAAAPLALREWGPRQLWQEGKRSEALQALRQLRAEAPLDETLCTLQADWEDELDDHVAYVSTAGELMEIAPLDARSHNYLGHALLKAGRAAEALAPLQQALALLPGYAFAATQLVEAARKADRPELAEPALQALWPHRRTARTASQGIEMAVAAGRREHARVWLERLFELDSDDVELSKQALQCWRTAGTDWAAELAARQLEQVRRGGGPTGVVIDWLEQRERRSFWWTLVEAWAWLRQLERERGGPYLLRGLLRWMRDNDARISFKFLIHRFEAAVRADPTAWGEVSYSLYCMDEYATICRWHKDWREQPRAPDFALANIAGALAERGRWDELTDLVATGLPRFPYQENLRLWQLLLQARAGDTAALQGGLARLQEWTPDAWMKPMLEALRLASRGLEAQSLSRADLATLNPRDDQAAVSRALLKELARSLRARVRVS